MKIKNKKTKIILGLIFAIFIVFFAYSAFAAEVGIKFNVDFPRVPAPVPGGFLDLNCIQGQNTNLCRSDYQYTPDIKTLVVFIFSAAVWLAGLIAFGVLLYAGFLYIFAGSAPANKSKAKEMFVNVVWGLAILLLSVVTLRLINPSITNLGNPDFTEIDPGTFDFDTFDMERCMEYVVSTDDPFTVRTSDCVNFCISGGNAKATCYDDAARLYMQYCTPDNAILVDCFHDCSGSLETAIINTIDNDELEFDTPANTAAQLCNLYVTTPPDDEDEDDDEDNLETPFTYTQFFSLQANCKTSGNTNYDDFIQDNNLAGLGGDPGSDTLSMDIFKLICVNRRTGSDPFNQNSWLSACQTNIGSQGQAQANTLGGCCATSQGLCPTN